MEPSFPRGGTIRAEAPLKRTKKLHYGAQSIQKDVKNNPSKRMREKDAKKKRDEGVDSERGVKSANSLSINTISQNMLLMGYVKSVHALHIMISLPGRMMGKVPITNISKAYTELLQKIVDNEDLTTKSKTLVDMFPIGQLVYVKVIEKCHGVREEILLSMMPQDLHSEMGVSMLEEGHAMMCAVQTSEDHGYLMETGIKGVQAFLPKKNIKTEPTVGEMVFCHITKVISGTITLNSFRKNELQKIETADVPNLKTLLPGLIVTFTIVGFLKNGVEGLLFDGSITAYANEFHLAKQINIADPAIIGKELKARILYIMPLSNHVFVTLNVNEVKTTDIIKYGSVIQDAKVIRQTSNGILLKLNAGGSKGLISRKTLVKNLKNNFDIDSALIKFSPNSVHAVRVMSYSPIENIYVCSNDKTLLHETHFSTDDLKISQLIVVKVVLKLESGFEVKIGQVRGFLKNVLWHEKVSISVGDSIKVRVVEIDSETNSIQVTNLPGFLKEGHFLWNVQHTIGTFSGVIFKETKNSFLVLFFNHLKGIFPKTPENLQELDKIGGLKVGTVRGFQIKSASKGKIFLHLPKPQESDDLGKIYDCKITSIFPNAIQVHIPELKCFGKVSINYLSEFPSMTNTIYSSLKEGDAMKVVALTNSDYSRRDVDYYQSGPVTDFQDVKPGDILRCFVKNFTDRMVELSCPLKNFTESIKLGISTFENADDRIFQLDEIVYVSVIGKNDGIKKSLYVTPNLSNVWNNDMDASVKIVENYLKDVDLTIQNMKRNGKPLAQFTVGQRVTGKVNSVLSNKLLIELPNGVFGQIPIKDMNSYKIGNEIKNAVVVFVDPVQQVLHLSIDMKILSEISETQIVPKGFNMNKKYKTIIVFSNEHVKVCTIRQPNQPLIYVPARFHYNDYSPVTKPDFKNATSKLIVKQITNNKVIGVFVHDFKIGQKLEKYRSKIISSVLKRKSESVEGQENKRVKKDTKPEESEEEMNVTDQIDSGAEENPEDATPVNTTEKVQRNVLKKLSNVGNKGRKLGRNVSESFRNKTKTLTKRKDSHRLNTQNKDSMLDGSLVNLVSFKKIKEDQKESEKSPEKAKPKPFKKKLNNQKSPKRLKNKKLVYKIGK